MATGFSFAVLTPQQQARRNCFFPQRGSRHSAVPKHRFLCLSDKMAVLCSMQEEQCRSLQPYHDKKLCYRQVPGDRSVTCMNTLTTLQTFRRGRQEGLAQE